MATQSDIHMIMLKMGVGYKYKGAQMIEYAVMIAMQHPGSLQLVTKWLYPQVAKELNTTPTRVERNIRTVIDMVWRTDQAAFEDALNRKFHRKPTNAAFLSAMADELYMLELRPAQ